MLFVFKKSIDYDNIDQVIKHCERLYVSYLFCGLVIGVVMGLTGAGGALVAIPLFMQFFDMSLKEASVYSLVAVVVASLMNYIAQRTFTQYRTASIIVGASTIGSYLTAPFKEMLPTFYVAVILAMVSLYALLNVWKPSQVISVEGQKPFENTLLSITVGMVLGTLTTFTGLGGGVLMLPLLLAIYRYSQAQAVATSLFAVGLSSLASLVVQVVRGASFELDHELATLLFGILMSVLLLKKFVKHLPVTVVGKTRQVVFSIVVLIAISKIF